MSIDNTKQIVEVEIGNDHGYFCDYCDVGALDNSSSMLNHYFAIHRFVLLCVAPKTSHGEDGHPWQRIVAVLGREQPIPRIRRRTVVMQMAGVEASDAKIEIPRAD